MVKYILNELGHLMENKNRINYLTTLLAVVMSIGLFLFIDYTYFSPVNRINYSNLILELTLSMFALVPLFAIQKYKGRQFYWNLNFGFYLLFVSYLVDALDQLFLHGILYTVLLEKITLIIAALFIFFGSKQWMRSYEIIALTDDLTNIANRRLIRKIVTKEIKHFQNHTGVFSLAIIDIDYFKVINDKYGHNIGDITLKSFAQLLKSVLDENYELGRWGGEEFLVLLKNKDIAQAEEEMNALRKKIADHVFTVSGKAINFTISTGISQVVKQDQEFESLFNRADRVLFQAKQMGRNQVKSHKVSIN